MQSMNISKHERRVVITGMGVIAPNGSDLNTFWNSVRLGISPVDFVTRFPTEKLPSRAAAEVRNFDPTDYMDAKLAKRLERSLQFGIAAAKNAATDANLDFSQLDPDRVGVVEGTSMSNMQAVLDGGEAFKRRGHRSISPSVMINCYVGGGSGEIAEVLGIKGHAISLSSSSASGNDVMGYAARMIRHEDVDVMIAGGAEAPIVEEVWSGFIVSRAMSRNTTDPTRAMRPFDESRDGFVLGEGAAYVVMEELTHALSRGARIYAEVLGHGRSCDAYHPIAPHPEGVGVRRAMEKALREAQVQPDEVDYINPHGSSTQANDLTETRAIKDVFGKDAYRLAVSGTKPITGHPMAAAGALETVICCLALDRQVIPMTLNLTKPGEGCDLDYVGGQSRPYPIRVALNLNCGFGGKNSCLVLRKYPR
jgi:beta-ketoacyl-acyl-carrier-protein synthase II